MAAVPPHDRPSSFLALQTNPFDGKPSTYSSSSAKPTSPETLSSNPLDENQESDRPGTPVPSEDPDSADAGESADSRRSRTDGARAFSFSHAGGGASCAGDKPNALSEPRGEEDLTKKGKKKKTVHWAQEDHLKHYFYFDLDETERGMSQGLENKCCVKAP